MLSITIKNFNLPWHQHDHYWIGVAAKEGGLSPKITQALQQVGLSAVGDVMAVKTGQRWKAAWDAVYANLQQVGGLNEVEVSVFPGDEIFPNASELDRKSTAAIQVIAENLWLGDALQDDRIMCYLQPVLSQKDKIFGYESFARAKGEDGKIIGGDKIMDASRALGIEFAIDRLLQVQAIKTFVASDFNGFLFVNFSPGFIHRPAVYLEGLSETAKSFGIIAKHLVLDFTKSETPRDMVHLKSVCEYARSRGYSIALDDIESLESATKLVPEVKPDFIKIDMKLARLVAEANSREVIKRIVEFAHVSGGTVIAEGVETEDMYLKLKQLGVDLFQGYYFSPPVPVEVVLKRGAATG
jgi:EAL domain-containing protein (putative c-di-GMP-specific phosphodiesterase class I)